jgi:hypothetical protein
LASANLAIISDGCSFGGTNPKPPTELGAQILARRASQLLKKNIYLDHNILIHECAELIADIGLNTDCLAATLGWLQVGNINIMAHLVGDGCIIGRSRYNKIHVYNYEFKSGAPFYLRYELGENPTCDDYIQMFGDKVIETCDIINVDNVIQEYNYFDEWYDGIIKEFFHFNNFDVVAIASDGINSFIDTDNNPVSRNLIIEELFKFRNYNPGFLERRCNRAFQTFAERGWVNQDDFSIGTIYVG